MTWVKSTAEKENSTGRVPIRDMMGEDEMRLRARVEPRAGREEEQCSPIAELQKRRGQTTKIFLEHGPISTVTNWEFSARERERYGTQRHKAESAQFHGQRKPVSFSGSRLSDFAGFACGIAVYHVLEADRQPGNYGKFQCFCWRHGPLPRIHWADGRQICRWKLSRQPVASNIVEDDGVETKGRRHGEPVGCIVPPPH